MDADIIERATRELQRQGKIPEPKYLYAFMIVVEGSLQSYNSAKLCSVVAVSAESKKRSPLQTHSVKGVDMCVMPYSMGRTALLSSGVLLAMDEGFEITHATDTCVYMRKKINE